MRSRNLQKLLHSPTLPLFLPTYTVANLPFCPRGGADTLPPAAPHFAPRGQSSVTGLRGLILL